MFSRGFSFLSDQPVAHNRLVQVSYLNGQPLGVANTINMTYDGMGRRSSITEIDAGGNTIAAKTYV